MASPSIKSLPPLAPFPEAAWRTHMVPEEWEACLDAWILLAEAHISLSEADLARISARDESISAFLVSYMLQAASSTDLTAHGDVLKWKRLHKTCFLFTGRLLSIDRPPESLVTWTFLSDLSKAYGKKYSSRLIASLWSVDREAIEKNLAGLKAHLIEQLDLGIKGRPVDLERHLKRLDHFLHSSPQAATFFMNGSDFLDGLLSCFKMMNPPLRKAIISTAYLLLIGLTEGPNPRVSLLTDQLYSMKAAADDHRARPTSVDDSMVAELVTVTPILKQLQHRIENIGPGSGRAKSVLDSLEAFRKAGGGRPKRFVERKVDKGKKVSRDSDNYSPQTIAEIHVHQMSLISQVQDLFPNLGSRFVTKLLDEYGNDVEQVISHLLEDSLPAHLESADRTEALSPSNHVLSRAVPDIAPRSTPPLLPTRRNVFDNDELDQLVVDTSRLHFGRRNPHKNADDILQDRSTAPNKTAIFSALAAFDSDDDERDDTYDVEDVGGTVDSATPGNNTEEANTDSSDGNDDALFQAFKMTPSLFDRDATTRRGNPRMSLKKETGMTDEAIEGWALMLSRDPRRMRRLEAKFSSFFSQQTALAASGWRPDPGGSGTEDSDQDGRAGRGGVRGRGGRGRGGRGKGGNVMGPAEDKETEVARHKKEANKGSRANHNRRDQRAKKMAKSGLPG